MRLSLYGKVNLIATYYFIVGGLLLILAFAVLILPTSAALLNQSEFLARLPGWFLGIVVVGAVIVIGAVAAVFLTLGWGLWQIKPWARMASMIAAVIQIPFVPIGTLAGGAILYVLMQDSIARASFWEVTGLDWKKKMQGWLAHITPAEKMDHADRAALLTSLEGSDRGDRWRAGRRWGQPTLAERASPRCRPSYRARIPSCAGRRRKPWHRSAHQRPRPRS